MRVGRNTGDWGWMRVTEKSLAKKKKRERERKFMFSDEKDKDRKG
jgi:hypothetical protein